MRLVMLVTLVYSVSCGGKAAFEDFSRGSSMIGMGGTSVAVFGSPWTSLTNPGLLPSAEESVISLFYTPGLYGLSELEQAAFVIQHPFSFGAIGVHVSVDGFNLYKELTAGISCGWEILDEFWAGIALRSFSLAIDNYGSDWTFGVDAGVTLMVTGELTWGFSFHNLNKPVIGPAAERLPQSVQTGVLFSPAGNIRLAIDLLKDIRYPAELRVGMEYRLLNIIALRAGGSVAPELMSVGLGIYDTPVMFDYALTSHPVLGVTHSFTMTIRPADLLSP